MKKELSINTTPILACYGYESYNDAIVSNRSYVNDTVAIIDNVFINNEQGDINMFNFLSDSITCENKDGVLIFRATSHALRYKGLLYLKVSDDYDISFCVKHHLYTSPWSLIAAFASASLDEFKEENKPNGKTPYLFGYFKKTGYWKCIGDDSCSINRSVPDGSAYWIKIKKYQGDINAYVSQDGTDWSLVSSDTLELKNDSYTGIYIDLGESSYYNWLYSNHLQIFCCDTFSGNCPPIEYFFPMDPDGMTKNNPFIHEYQIPYSLVESQNIRLNDLIHYCIDHNIYLDLSLNEKYIENRWAYNRCDFDHYNMVFGYNDDENTVSIFGYNKASKASVTIVDYNRVLKAFEKSEKRDLVLRKHEIKYSPEELSFIMIKSLIEDYLNSKDSSWRYPGACVKRDGCAFGIAVYDCIVSNDYNFLYFLKDLRIAYFLVEHKRIMHDRVVFFADRKLLPKDVSKSLIAKAKKLSDMASNILLLIMKYRATGDHSLPGRIKKSMLTEKENDIDFCKSLLGSLAEQ